jgi:hypothetical protein
MTADPLIQTHPASAGYFTSHSERNANSPERRLAVGFAVAITQKAD